MTDADPDMNDADPDLESCRLSPEAEMATHWFAARVQESLGDNLINLTVYGPAVTSMFRITEHQIHYLLVLKSRNVDHLLSLAQHSAAATSQQIAPPLIITADAMSRSHDVFPLEWLDISQFHRAIIGDPGLTELQLQPAMVRLQCERELRSLDMQLQRGILASGGEPGRVNRMEDEASDTLVRVMRGIGWLAGNRTPLLPSAVCERCAVVTGQPLPGCAEAIRVDGRHDIETARLIIGEIAELSRWIDDLQSDKS